jgi:hypothetical protein
MQILVKQCCQTEHDIGGTAFPLALTARANVTKVPLSAKVMDPTCLTPFLMILSGRCAVYIYIRMKKNTIKIRNSQNNYGKLYVFNLLKPI